MKITKSDLIWLIAVVVLYVLYNIPGVPEYLNPKGTMLHGALTLIPLWLVSYIGMFRIFKVYKIRKNAEEEDNNK